MLLLFHSGSMRMFKPEFPRLLPVVQDVSGHTNEYTLLYKSFIIEGLIKNS